MIGRRVEWSAQLLEPGDYAKLPDGSWMGESPNGYGANLSAHTVVEHEDGTVTVSPSILLSRGGHRDDKGNLVRDETFVELWHGYLERGVWRAV